MKRIYFIGGAGIIISILIGFWVYSFLYGTPTNTNSLFTNLGIFGNESVAPAPEITPVEVPRVDVAMERLRQITTKPVIGARDYTIGSSTIMRYVEAGTGHIYDIDLVSGQENRISQISVPRASEAMLSARSEYVAIRSGYSNQNEVALIDLTTLSTPTQTLLPYQIETFSFASGNDLLFTEISGGQTELKSYSVGTADVRRLALIPFTSVAVSWSTGSNTPHVVYNKPASSLVGYAYEVTAAGLQRLPFSGRGLTLNHNQSNVLFGRVDGNRYTATVFSKAQRSYEAVVLDTLPEKCVAEAGASFVYYCAGMITAQNEELPDSWYKGSSQFDDRLWQIQGGAAQQLSYPLDEVGRSLDIANIRMTANNRMLYFVNKTDKTLWIYEL